MSLMQKIRRRGIVFSFATLFNRLMPAKLFRMGVMEIGELCPTLLKQNFDESESGFETVTEPEARVRLQQATWNAKPVSEIRNHSAFGIRNDSDDSFAGGLWVATRKYFESELGFQIELPDGAGWVYCAYVDKSQRGQGIYSKGLAYAASQMEKKSVPRLLVAFNPWNKASAYVHQKYMKLRVGRIWSVKFLSLAICFSSGNARPMKSFTFSSGKSPNVVSLS